ncbi:MAG: hypothetical protein BJ554DRAFT_4207 [Olpidium bornovanus]|uniref:Uncharacterized protein n=1 Tax=Olpidium bornovanus TaxID=278681 RepID=A0A8H7ZN26_9FUNG|nr:MAG: hypothetical protein BJ554DRAFT_4207 [Olpidium bornovanus]
MALPHSDRCCLLLPLPQSSAAGATQHQDPLLPPPPPTPSPPVRRSKPCAGAPASDQRARGDTGREELRAVGAEIAAPRPLPGTGLDVMIPDADARAAAGGKRPPAAEPYPKVLELPALSTADRDHNIKPRQSPEATKAGNVAAPEVTCEMVMAALADLCMECEGKKTTFTADEISDRIRRSHAECTGGYSSWMPVAFAASTLTARGTGQLASDKETLRTIVVLVLSMQKAIRFASGAVIAAGATAEEDRARAAFADPGEAFRPRSSCFAGAARGNALDFGNVVT